MSCLFNSYDPYFKQPFGAVRAGQTVAEFITACGEAGIPEKEAKANIAWDRRKGFITVEAGA